MPGIHSDITSAFGDTPLVRLNAVTEGRSAVYAVQARGGEWIPITQGIYWDDKPRWSPDGRVLYFTSARRGFVNVWARRFDPDRGEAIGEAFAVTHDFAPKEREILLHGGLLHYLKEQRAAA